MVPEQLYQCTFDNLMNLALSKVDDTLDKRQGSIIYDALAPACYVLAAHYSTLINFYTNTYGKTAIGQYLDDRVYERGLTRYQATYAIRKGWFRDASNNPITVDLGTRFCTIDDTNPIYYHVLCEYYNEAGVVVPGYYMLQCEILGTEGNKYTGDIINLGPKTIAKATIVDGTPLVPARDLETDDELRERYIASINAESFGGNIQNYRELVLGIEGVGAVQIYPVWNGGGTVKLVILDPLYGPCGTEFIAKVKQMIDPTDYEQEGVGLAPIGHKVTVGTATKLTVNISFNLELESGVTLSQIQSDITAAIEGYIFSIRQEWSRMTKQFDYSGQKVYIAYITNAVLGVDGVDNITSVKINNQAVDLSLTETATLQQLPYLGTVTINVVS